METGIKFTLRMGRNEYLPGQPAIAYLSLTNNSDHPISAIDLFDPKYDFVKFSIEFKGIKTTFMPYTMVDVIPKSMTLNTGDSINGYAKIFYGSNGYTFTHIGIYEITATYYGLTHSSKAIESNKIEVKIREPKDDQEKEQVILIKGEEQALFLLFEGGDHLSKGIENLTLLAEKYPNSVLGTYANAVLGIHWSKNFKDIVKNKIREPNIEASNEFLSAAKDNVKGHWANSSFLTLAHNYDKLGSKDNKINTLNQFVEKYKDDSKNTEGIKVARKILDESI